MKVAEFLPPVILEKDREKPWMEWVPGAVLFADVSGFTPMSEALSVLGAEGGEVLTDVLNRYFAAMIGIVHAHGGQVMKFGGDAILCFFPETAAAVSGGGRLKAEGGNAGRQEAGSRRQEEPDSLNLKLETWNLELDGGMGGASLPRALAAAWKMQGEMPRFQNIKTPVKRFALKMKIGVADGECLLAGVGDPAVRCDYVFAGAPVDATSDAEHHAVAGEIVFAGDKCKLQIANCKMEEVEPGFYRILDVPAELKTRNSKLETATQAKACGYISSPNSPATSYELRAAASYLIHEIHAMVEEGFGNQVGALLDIVPVFLRFNGFEYASEKFNLARFHAFFTLVMEITHRHGGRLNRISMGDKGSTFFILFGAPNALEKKEELACQWALDLQQEVGAQFPEIALGVGMNAGRVFAGIVGGAGRSEYTVMGDAVNFAARLMQGARDGQVCLSGLVRERAGWQYAFADLGSRRFKGKAEPLPVFALEGRRKDRRAAHGQPALVGRAAESASIQAMMEKALGGEPGMCVIEGEPGIGKSCLADHLLNEAERSGWTVVVGKGEITRRNHAYAPWKDALGSLFFGEGEPGAMAVQGVLSEEFSAYLPWHLEFFGLSVPETMALPKHDEETRKRLFQHQLSVMVMSRAAQQPILLFLDDLHWLDTLSLELMLGLLNHLKDQPVFVLATARPGWEKNEFESRPACKFLALDTMEKPDIKALAEAMLGGAVRDDLVEFVSERTKGNPFFTQQVLEYLKGEDLLEIRLGDWFVKREAQTRGVPGSEGLVLARIGRLPVDAQEHLKIATCIGPSFELPVLKHALGSRFHKRAMDTLLESDLLVCVGQDDMAFPHALVQETLYAAIPQKVRRQHHRRIGIAMETLHAGALKGLYPNLANHFRLAGRRDKTLEYSILAAEQLTLSLSYPEASRYWGIAFDGAWRLAGERRCWIGLQWGKVLLRSGQLERALALAGSIQRSARRLGLTNEALEAQVIRFDALDRMGRYTYCSQIQMILSSGDSMPLIVRAHVLHQLGVAHLRSSRFDLALNAFEEIASLGLDEDNEDVLSSIVFLAHIAMLRAEHQKALALIEAGLRLADKGCKAYQRIRLKIERAAILMHSGHPSEAWPALREQLPQAEALGDYYLLSVIMMNLGYVAISQHHWDEADSCLQDAMKACALIGFRNGWAKALMNRGIAAYHQRCFEQAYECYLEATTTMERLGESSEMCHGYYNLAEVCLELDRIDEARNWFQKGIVCINPKDHPRVYCDYLALKPKVFQGDGEPASSTPKGS